MAMVPGSKELEGFIISLNSACFSFQLLARLYLFE